MNDPIRIDRGNQEPEYTHEQLLAAQKERHARRIQWVFLGFIGVVVLGFLTPLVVFLTRLALG